VVRAHRQKNRNGYPTALVHLFHGIIFQGTFHARLSREMLRWLVHSLWSPFLRMGIITTFCNISVLLQKNRPLYTH